MSRAINSVLKRLLVVILIVSNVFFGFPFDPIISAINTHIARSKIVDRLYWSQRDPQVVDRTAPRIPTLANEAHAATVATQMAELYVGSRASSTTAISNYAFNWQAPTGITSLTVEARGGGGGGGGSGSVDGGGGGGGGGGGYALSTNVSATAGTTYPLAIGKGGAAGPTTDAGGNGTASTFATTTVVAAAGNGGIGGGSGTGGTGGTSNTGNAATFNGGGGSDGTSGTRSGGGGGGAGSAGNGTTASSNHVGGAGGSGGGGAGGNGISGATGQAPGFVGNVYSGGGGGGKRNNSAGTSQNGSSGAGGALSLSYTYNADNLFPIIRGMSGSRTTNVDGTAHNITLPTGIAAEELLIVVFAVDANETVSINTTASGNNWTILGQQTNGTAVTGAVVWKVAEGEGADALQLTTTSEQSSHVAYRISNYTGTPTASSTSGSSTNSNPPNHTPAGGSGNYLWIATRSGDAAVAPTSTPSGYSFWRQADASGSAGATTDSAVRFANGSSENPGTWGVATEQWVSFTISVLGGPRPTDVTLYPDDGGSTQIGFNNARQNSTTPTFRASALHPSGTFNRFQVELNTSGGFDGTAYTQTFSSTYTSGTQYNLAATSLSPSLPTTNGVTYYVRVRASSDGGSTYGSWSTGFWTYTYKSASEDPDWFQTTDEQFTSGTTFAGTIFTGSDSVRLNVSSSTGTFTSPPIDFDWVLAMSTWGEANWTEDQTNGTISMQVYYNDGDDCDTLIPNGDLSGNGSGFASGPIDLSGLNTTTYNRICLRATLTDSGGTPFLTDWTVTWADAPAGELSVDIVDASGSPVASPFLFMSTSSVALTSQVTTGTLGAVGQKVRVTNGTGTPSWSLTVAASSTTAFWDGTSADYDFNDPTANGVDGGDADSLGGQLRFNPSAGTITPEGGCSSTDLSLGNSAGFSEGSVDDITLVTAGGSADTDCYWDLTGLSASSTIPAQQPADTYRIDMILTVTASMQRKGNILWFQP